MVFSQRIAQFVLLTSSASGASMPAPLPEVNSVSSPISVSLIVLLHNLVLPKGEKIGVVGKTPAEDIYYPIVQTSVDDAYACIVYSSCKGTSFISAAGVSSSIGFLNFLGFNGAPYSLSFIDFISDWEGVTDDKMDSLASPRRRRSIRLHGRHEQHVLLLPGFVLTSHRQ
jgi:hypothetical protein